MARQFLFVNLIVNGGNCFPVPFHRQSDKGNFVLAARTMCYPIRSGRRIYSRDDPIFGPSPSSLPSPGFCAPFRENFFNLPNIRERTSFPISVAALDRLNAKDLQETEIERSHSNLLQIMKI